MNIWQEPGLWTDTANPGSAAQRRADNFKWIVQQAQNDLLVKPWDLSTYKAQGFKVGTWGVSYTQGSLRRNMADLVNTSQGADLISMNCEFQIQDSAPLIEQGRFFNGPKALITLVGQLVSNKQVMQELVNAGWDIIGETYYNDQINLTPAEAEWQRLNAGIPVDRFSHALGMYFGLRGFVTGAEYASLLAQAGAGRRFSCWMVEHGADSNYTQLAAQALAPNPGGDPASVPPPPPPVYGASQARADIERIVEKWKQGQPVTVSTNRLIEITRIAGVANTDTKWNSIKAQIDTLLKSQGL